ncbi:phosphoglycerate mutase (2,3-diphosphoglycerate-independent) [Candidatus Falkowbacteria bacterium RBG_13_39_14]|uniref:2,3-bisphosphoglycerate-independent phosphoglycerate mutase n=1 Tax=Candidatus Falkowbacteria bacterium RBG_13_39_14 TaxID=1797985 RepID=A0A1F5S4A3_9BACT|nr:MAG: phosphoglycerate mutase (2,3-diphosphoglycerate-independent) [Candidatus Falkowbacteria bacterium RBG_13_39_14]
MNTENKTSYRPVVLLILDGWGVAPPSRCNAITMAKTPAMDKIISSYPAVTLQASGESVGLPWGEMGNSEVGHLNLGAGKIVYQDLPRITNAILNGTFFTNRHFLAAMEHVKNSKGKFKLHLIGLLSSAGVHAYTEHLFALMEMAKQNGVKDLYIHAILDGRDMPYNTGIDMMEKLQAKIKELEIGCIASVSGRHYAMDRDNHWARIEKAYKAMTGASHAERLFTDPIDAIQASYDKKIYDEEFQPVPIFTKNGKPAGSVEDNDSVIFFNYRSDRARELTKAFVLPSFVKFERVDIFRNLNFVCMTEYEKNLPVSAAFPPEAINNPLAKVISDNKLKQLHIGETEKYAHVTHFFNGGKEDVYEGEERILIPSLRVESYAEKPEMSVREITSNVLKNLDKFDFIVINLANPDMVGHTGDLKATIRAVEAVDDCVRRITGNVLAKGGAIIITADHGNAEGLLDMQTGCIDKEHSTNPVPCVIVANEFEGKNVGKDANVTTDLSVMMPSGILADIAPTILKLMGIPKPEEMTGRSLI